MQKLVYVIAALLITDKNGGKTDVRQLMNG